MGIKVNICLQQDMIVCALLNQADEFTLSIYVVNLTLPGSCRTAFIWSLVFCYTSRREDRSQL